MFNLSQYFAFSDIFFQGDFEQELNKWVQKQLPYFPSPQSPTSPTTSSFTMSSLSTTTPSTAHELEEAMSTLGPLEDVPSSQENHPRGRTKRAMSIQQGELLDIADKLATQDMG